jgi:hypothetical protein
MPILKYGKEKGLYFIKMEKYSKELFLIMKRRGSVMNIIPIIHTIWEIFRKVNGLEKESFNGIMEKFTRENGKKIKNKVAAFGKDQKAFLTWENGTTI